MNCAGCAGCAGSACGALELTEPELRFLRRLAETPFLPVCRRPDSPDPCWPEDGPEDAEEYAKVLLCLEKKMLISLDYDIPLKGYDYSACGSRMLHGSMALTLRGQQVLDLLELQGIQES